MRPGRHFIQRGHCGAPPRHGLGFTLVELIVVLVIVGVLAAIAVPRFVALGQNARIASLKTLAGTLRSTAENVRVLCRLNPACDDNVNYQTLVLGGRLAALNYGWLDAGDAPSVEPGEIDEWVQLAGFTTVMNGGNEVYRLDGSPDPANCSVTYFDAYSRPEKVISITTASSGC